MGLSFGEKKVAFNPYKRKEKIIMLPVSEIAPNPLQPRKKFDEEEITFLAESIRQFGIIHPIAVKARKDGPCLKLNNETVYHAPYEIIAGERRWRAARRLGLKKIPCILYETDKPGSAMLALVENIQRKELGIFEEAAAINNLLLMTNMTQIELAKRLSVSQSSISNKLRLLKLTAEEREMITDASLTERHARALVRVDHYGSRIYLLNRMIDENLSASEAEKLVDDFLNGRLPEIKADEKGLRKIRKIGILKDIRFFFNTINRAIALLDDAGIKVKSERIEHDDYLEVVIKVAKNKAVQEI
ncbi:MAG TPA: ParB/RepB/Spo0J family partition protein [Bacillota bacterium]|nr:ParB/RepB/Spo0J family partition protein [Bacillota bacterium]HOK68379.1 ParB/RepB/Spo0J family partition protein [Bacillota bacterium]HPP85529.1 ParB/RepB/Spo0J family partition protein [Bacillota bacterium]